MKRIESLIVMALLAGVAAQGWAQSDRNFPERPVRVVVPWAAGGNADVLTRIMAQRRSETWGQQVLVDNRGGANGMIGSEMVVRSKPDGYTLLVDGVQTHAINPLIYAKMSYETQRDLKPITLLGSVLHILVVHPSLPVKNTAELIALAKARPQEIAYASFGAGTMSHLAGELFQQITGSKLLHVPYKGGGPALTGQLSGEVLLYWPGISIALPHIHSGRLRALGLASKHRSDDLPNLSTLAEQLNAPSYDITTSFSVMTPAGTPKDILDRLHTAITQALASQEVRKHFTSVGAASTPLLSPEDTLALFRSQSEHWGKVVRAANIKRN